MKWSVIVLAVAACGRDGQPTGPSLTIHTGVPATTVVSHHADGTTIDQEQADAVGDAVVVVDSDALVSVAYAFAPSLVTTTLAPPAGGELVIRTSVADTAPPLIVGTLSIQPPSGIAADHFVVDLGCTVLHLPSLAQPIQVAARCA